MASPKVHVPQKERVALPSVRTSLPVVNPGFQQLAGVLNNFVDSAEDQLDKETVRKAKAAGAVAGMEQDFSPTRGASLAEQAYDATAIDVFFNRTLIDSDVHLNRIAQENQGDPGAIWQQAQSVAAEISITLPEEVQGRFTNAFLQSARSHVNVAHDQVRRAVVDEHTATFSESERVFSTNMSTFARNGDQEALQSTIELYTDSINRNGPITDGGTGVLTVVGQQDRLNKARQLIERNTIIGQFDRIEGVTGQVQFVHDLVDRGTMKQIVGTGKDSVFTEDEVDALQSELYSMISRGVSVESSVDETKRRQLRSGQAEAKINFWRSPSEENMALVESLGVTLGDSSDIKAMRDYMATGGDVFKTDPAVVEDLRVRMRNLKNGAVTPSEIYSHVGKGLHPDVARQLESEWVEIQDRGTDFVQTNEWKEARRRIIAKFNVPTNPITGQIEAFSGADRERGQLANDALSKLFDDTSVSWGKFLKEGGDRPDILGSVRKELDRIGRTYPELFDPGVNRRTNPNNVDYGVTGLQD